MISGSKYNPDVITITFKDGNEVTAFKAAEVKKESQPLDVATIEQLCL